MGKSLILDPERAPIVRRVSEEFATGRFLLSSTTSSSALRPSCRAARLALHRRSVAVRISPTGCLDFSDARLHAAAHGLVGPARTDPGLAYWLRQFSDLRMAA
jgi:hypothetical protein